MSNIQVTFPQLKDAIDVSIEVRDQNNKILEELQALHAKLDTLTPAATVAKSPPTTPAAEKAKPVKGKVKILDVQHVPAPTDDADGEDDNNADDEVDEDNLRAQATFEARRTTRLFGLAGTRCVIKKIAGPNILNVDEVPLGKLPALIKALQAL